MKDINYPIGFTIFKLEEDKEEYTITGNLAKAYRFREFAGAYDLEEYIQKHIWCTGIEFDSEYCQFFAYAKTEQRAIKFCEDIQAWFEKIKELVS
jgi:hypothetical protein